MDEFLALDLPREWDTSFNSFDSHEGFDTTVITSSFPTVQIIAGQDVCDGEYRNLLVRLWDEDRGRWQYLGFDECDAEAYYLGSKDEPVMSRINGSMGNFPNGRPRISYESGDFVEELREAFENEDNEPPFRW